MTNDDECTCYPVPEHLHTTHYGATDPASTLEPNPECPVHFPVEERDPIVRVSGPGITQQADTVWIGPAGAEPPSAAALNMARLVGHVSQLDGATWYRIDGGFRPRVLYTDPNQQAALDRVREGAIAWWNGQQR